MAINTIQPPKFVTGVPLVIITGISGAGKTTAMRFLEDLGCYCLDNLPPSLIPDFFNLYEQGGSQSPGAVIVSDVRSGSLFDVFSDTIKELQSSSVKFSILYLDCSTETVIKRFKEVRRTHPLQVGISMSEAIEEERNRLAPIKHLANYVIDTSNIKAAGLRESIIRALISEDTANVVRFKFYSFGFKYGTPRDVDYVFDVRFLANPFYEKELRSLTGEDDDVYQYVMAEPLADKYFESVVNTLEITLESFVKVGKTQLTIGIGCTGGRHRSVAFARRLAEYFSEKGHHSRAAHRDMRKPQS